MRVHTLTVCNVSRGYHTWNVRCGVSLTLLDVPPCELLLDTARCPTPEDTCAPDVHETVDKHLLFMKPRTLSSPSNQHNRNTPLNYKNFSPRREAFGYASMVSPPAKTTRATLVSTTDKNGCAAQTLCLRYTQHAFLRPLPNRNSDQSVAPAHQRTS